MNIKGFKFIEMIGTGSTGTVYKAYDETLERNVAIKILHKELNNDIVIVERFIREAKTAASLIHPNIISIFSIKQEKDLNCIIMEYYDGKNLAELIKEKTKLQLYEATEIILQCIQGITFAHDKGILHRDLKPENIIYSEKTNIIKIVDFGLAKILDAKKNLTITGKLLGSPCYMSPEQIKGLPIDKRSDLYSLGVLYFYLLTGKLPYESENISGYIYKTLHEPIPSIKQIESSIPENIENIICSLMDKSPERRFIDGKAFKKELIKFISPKDQIKLDKNNRKIFESFNFYKNLKVFLIIILIVFSYIFFINAYRKIPNVEIQKNQQNAWQLSVNGIPFLIKGVNFNPINIGLNCNANVSNSWFFYDENNNNINDIAFETYIDENNNNIKDADEKEQGDFKLLHDAGFNTIKVQFSPPKITNNDERLIFQNQIKIIKSLFQHLYKDYKIMVILNYSFTFEEFQTDIKNCELKNMEAINLMLETFKKEPYLLLYIIDCKNIENDNDVKDKKELITKIVKSITEKEKSHPFAISLETSEVMSFLEFSKSNLNIIYAIDTNMGDEGFYNLWTNFKRFDRPILISGFGIGSYNLINKSSDEDLQLNFLKGSWNNIVSNSFIKYKTEGEGNAIGGIINEWLDCWNKDGEPKKQNIGTEKNNITPDNLMHNEWMGIISQGSGKNSPFLRKPKKAYYCMKEVFNTNMQLK